MEVLTGNVNENRHVPWVRELENGYRVTVGKPSLHPMDEIHYIEYVELYVDGELVGKKDLQPRDKFTSWGKYENDSPISIDNDE